MSTRVFGQPSTLAFGASLAPTYENSMSAFSASSTPAFSSGNDDGFVLATEQRALVEVSDRRDGWERWLLCGGEENISDGWSRARLSSATCLLSVEPFTGSTVWIGKGISCVCAQGIKSEAHLIFDLTSSQEQCLHRLQRRIAIVYDSSKKEHQEALKAIWGAAYPGVELLGLISEQWKDMGWQGKDPSTDFRGGGFISVENMLFFARNYPVSYNYFAN
ncbi:hypothetical protein ZIOFF_054036 [Zingiber officinale]|uniref:ELMO domain-containing protein n=1 Tax=Zingiber officinale TaxID=94328 RepID=A0A8J5FGZ1_ZINOF|nr:hypothetical protein ZIOFF_054036 [Zingiber officinale]